MEGVNILTEINPKLSLLNNEVSLSFLFQNQTEKEIPKNFNLEAKVSINIHVVYFRHSL